MYTPFALLLFLIILLIYESIDIDRKVSGIKTRIHINGTRGKSSITRYIAAGMRASEQTTIAKITGVRPTIIGPDGKSCLIKRRGCARVQEQFTIINRAARMNAGCLVLECMSILPEYQKVESRKFRPHIYVLTNILDDHREKLGRQIEDQAAGICSAIPSNTRVLTVKNDYLDTIRKYAGKKNSRVIVVDDLDGQIKSSVPEGVFPANVALALAACTEAGVSPNIALPAILEEAGISGERPIDLNRLGSKALFINGFAVNDTPSAEKYITCWQRMYPQYENLFIIFNSRADRPLRSEAFAAWMGRIPDLAGIILIGNHAPYMKKTLVHSGISPAHIMVWTKNDIIRAGEKLLELKINDALIVGLGNISGDGFRVIETLAGEIGS
nr:poly-gamma-glutamate synthase PgsB [candidate division Zixibacteria bacterium]